jgi:hypothetical protein
VVGDVHGEFQALLNLMTALGYSDDGTHQDGRRLVFVGGLTDRGPDSPGVVRFVDRMLEAGLAQCVLGNHDLNILSGLRKYDNGWFFGEKFIFEGHEIVQQLADDVVRAQTLELFRKLPVALERDDLRIVHAYWDQPSVDSIRGESDAVALFEFHKARIKAHNQTNPDWDCHDRDLNQQLLNPVRLLTSGPEQKAQTPFVASGRTRYLKRVKWWENQAAAGPVTMFGHYSLPYGYPRVGSAICCDYAVAGRWRERIRPDFVEPYVGRLAAVRVPEMRVVFDDGSEESVVE